MVPHRTDSVAVVAPKKIAWKSANMVVSELANIFCKKVAAIWASARSGEHENEEECSLRLNSRPSDHVAAQTLLALPVFPLGV